MNGEQLVARLGSAVDELATSRKRTLVALDGPDAAGKTVLATRLSAALSTPVVRAGIDGFHRPRSERRQRGPLSPEGYYRDSYDESAFVDRLLVPFTAGKTAVVTAVFDHRVDAPVNDRVTVTGQAVLLVDGVFLLRPSLRHWWTLSVYLQVSEEEMLRRAVARDADLFGSEAEVRRRYRQRYLPGQRLYRHDAHPEAQADIVIDNSDFTAPRVVCWSLPSSADARRPT